MAYDFRSHRLMALGQVPSNKKWKTISNSVLVNLNQRPHNEMITIISTLTEEKDIEESFI